MRIDLVTPFAEKEQVKALGARWDAAKRIWYITDVEDLTPFLRWIPDAKNFQAASGVADKPPKATQKQSSKKPSTTKPPSVPVLAVQVPHCGCNVLPWEHCKHTENTRSLTAIQHS